MHDPFRRRPSRALRLVLLAVVGLAVGLLVPSTPAQAAATPSAPSPAVLAGHACTTFGLVGVSAYVGVQCIDFDKTGTSMRAIGSTTCHTRAGNLPVQCTGIIEVVTIATGAVAKSATYTCGSFGGADCPITGTKQLSGPSPFIFCPPTGEQYKATIRSTVVTPPLDLVTLRSADFSISWATNC